MDLGIVLGLLVAVGSVLIALLIDQASLSSYFKDSALLIVLGGTLGATMCSVSLQTFLRVPALLKTAVFSGSRPDSRGLIAKIASYSSIVRREGMLALEAKLDEQNDPFVRKALQLVIDGLDGSTVIQILDNDIQAMERRHKLNYSMFTVMAGYAPAMGVLGTVLGLISMLMGLGDSTEGLGSAVAVAFLTTLYGVVLANMIFLPIATSLKTRSEDEATFRRVVLEAVLALQTGENPRLMTDKLLATAGLKKVEPATEEAVA